MDQGEQLTLFTEDSRASLFPTPGSGEERRTTATSGLRCLELYRRSGPLGLLLKMLMGSSQWSNPIVSLSWKTKQLYARKRKWSSKPSGKILRTKAMNPSQLLFQLQVSARRTGDTESSFWATPNAADAKGSHGGGQGRSLRTDIANLKAGLRPTPRAQNANGPGDHGAGGKDLQTTVQAQERLWPTPRAGDAEKRGDFDRHNQWNGLPAAVKLWPTPAAQDGKNATLPPSQADRDTIPGAVMREGHEGQLNPEWVECLMGFPIGWTDIDREISGNDPTEED